MSTNKKAERKCSLIESIAIILVICFIFFYGSGLMGNAKVTMGMSMLLCSTLLGIYSTCFLHILGGRTQFAPTKKQLISVSPEGG